MESWFFIYHNFSIPKPISHIRILIINNDGIVIRLWAKEIPVLSRVTQGVTLMRSKNSTIVDVAIVDHEEETEEPEEGAEGENTLSEGENGQTVSENENPVEEGASAPETNEENPEA